MSIASAADMSGSPSRSAPEPGIPPACGCRRTLLRLTIGVRSACSAAKFVAGTSGSIPPTAD